MGRITLYVALMMAFASSNPGQSAKSDNRASERGVTDGMRVDTKGNLYETGPGGIWIISPEGKHLGTIRAPEQATNVGFGDADKKTLYIAARTGIYRIRVNTPGI